MIGIVILLIFIAFFVIMGIITFKKIKSTNPNNIANTQKTVAETTQEFLPFVDIKDNMIDLGQYQYRAIIKCDSLNYVLKSDKEQDIIEMAYQGFLNSLTHPIQMFIATKIMDNTNMLKYLEEDINDAIKEFPILATYGQEYYRNMENLYDEIGNNKEKNKYIVVPYNDAITLTDLNDKEKYEHSYKELQNRCQIIIEGLKGIGINCNIMKTDEIIELLYSVYHRDSTSCAENISNGEYLKMTVQGKDKLENIDSEDILDWILYEAQVRLQTEIINNNSSNEDIKERTNIAINNIDKLRDEIAGKYKTDFHIEDKIDFYE